jgi:hypothetical protein
VGVIVVNWGDLPLVTWAAAGGAVVMLGALGWNWHRA